jgi:hypothetical protein
MPEIHLTYGGSTAARTLACPAWPRIVEESPQRPDTGSAAAERGTMLHGFMETFYRDGIPVEQQAGWNDLDDTDQEALFDAIGMTEEYLDTINAHTLLPEQFVQMAHNVGGSADLIAISDVVVAIIDFKFGYKPVTDRTQFLHYALCAELTPGIAQYLYDANDSPLQLQSVIIQPACHKHAQIFSHSVQEMNEYEAKLEAAIAAKDTAEPVAGDHCGYCKAAPYCPARRSQAAKFVTLNVKDLSQLSEAMGQVEQMKEQIRDVEAAVFAHLEAGDKVEGWKLVMKQARRYWKDAEAALAVLKKSRKVKHDMYIDEKLKSPAQVEKAVGKLIDMSQYWDNKSSGTTLAPSTDKRPAVEKAAAGTIADLFAAIGK